MFGRLAIAISAGTLLLAADRGPVPSRAWKTITGETLLKHIRVLASDEFEGRAPATLGEQKTIDYLVNACRALKLKPGNGDSFVQKVALWGITLGESSISILSGALSWRFGDSVVVEGGSVCFPLPPWSPTRGSFCVTRVHRTSFSVGPVACGTDRSARAPKCCGVWPTSALRPRR